MSKRIQLLIILAVIPFVLLACGDSIDTSIDEPAVENDDVEETDVVVRGEGNQAYDEKSLERLRSIFKPLGDVPVPEDNPMTQETIELGKTLFFDPRLSGDDSLSCASCHAPALGWSDGRELFQGFDDVEGPRHSPTIINTAYYSSLFWDGRAATLEEQALGPITSPIEMNQDLDELVEELNAIEEYVDMFDAAFGEGITVENIGKALAAFQRTIVVNDTPFDEFLAGDDDAMTESEIRGMELFAGDAQCITCHNGPNLTDNNFYNLGLEGDAGRMDVTGNPSDEGTFRTAGLYGIAHHAPYMHDGSLETLEDVIDYYDRGGDFHPNKSPKMNVLGLSEQNKEDLLAFLMALSGENPPIEVPDLPQYGNDR